MVRDRFLLVAVSNAGHGGILISFRIIINEKPYKGIQMCTNTDEGGQRQTVGRRVYIPLYRNRKGKGEKLTEYGPNGK